MSIFVGNLPFRAEKEDVSELFAPFGEVSNCALPLERDTGRKRGFAFIEMVDEASEDAAIEALQGAELMGRPLRINKAEPRGSAPRRGGGGGGGYGGGGGGGYGGGGTSDAGGERPSGARGWEDRSYGGSSSSESSAYDEGRSRRRRSTSSGTGDAASSSGGDAPGGAGGGGDYGDYGGAEG
ncbi:MAG: RNA recognition motif domain-containing protein [Prochlorococcus sp.]